MPVRIVSAAFGTVSVSSPVPYSRAEDLIRVLAAGLRFARRIGTDALLQVWSRW